MASVSFKYSKQGIKDVVCLKSLFKTNSKHQPYNNLTVIAEMAMPFPPNSKPSLNILVKTIICIRVDKVLSTQRITVK